MTELLTDVRSPIEIPYSSIETEVFNLQRELRNPATTSLTKTEVIMRTGQELAARSNPETRAEYEEFNRFLARNDALFNDPTFRPNLAEKLEDVMNAMQRHSLLRYYQLHGWHNRLQEPLYDVAQLRYPAVMVVDGLAESGKVYHTLTQIASQDLPPEEVETLAFINTTVPGGLQPSSEEAAKVIRTTQEIERFQRDHPECNVRAIVHNYTERQTMGAIRADAANLLAYDLWRRQCQQNVLMGCVDADAIFMNRHSFSSRLRKWEETGADVITGHLMHQRVLSLPQDSAANRIIRLDNLLCIVTDHYREAPLTPEPCTSYDLATYLAAGGFDRLMPISEAADLTMRIRLHRSPDHNLKNPPSKPVVIKAENAGLVTNARRVLAVMAMGHGPLHTWNEEVLEFGPDQALRAAAPNVTAAETHAKAHSEAWAAELANDYYDHYLKDCAGEEKARQAINAGLAVLRFATRL